MKEFEVFTSERQGSTELMPARAEIIPAGSMMLQPLEFSEEQKTLIKRMCQAEGLDDNEFQIFLHICQRRRLDPILRQIYATKRNKKVKEGNVEKWVKILVPIVAIEGITATAERTRTYAPSDKKPEYEFAKQGDKIPLACTVWMKKFSQGQWHEFPFTGYFSEFVQDTDTWRKMPFHMLMKCCRAGALRMGWPEDCGGLFLEEEWAPDTTGEPIEPAVRKERERGSIGKMKQSKEENRGHGQEGMEQTEKPPKVEKPLDQYNTSIIKAILKSNVNKEWIEANIEGGTASVWNEAAMAFKDEKIPLTRLYCWHKSLFEALLLRPQKIVLAVANKEGAKFSPIIEDILAVDGVKYEKGKPYVAPEVAAMPRGMTSVEFKEITGVEVEKAVSGKPLLADLKELRTRSILELTTAFEKLWPALDISKRPIRNKVGQAMLNLQSKEQLNDLAYPQAKLDAAVKALTEFAKIEPRPTTEDGILNDIMYLFNKALEPKEENIQDLFA